MFDFNLEFARNGARITSELINLLAADGIKENIVISPFSVQTAAALAFAGAKGDTADEIANGMKFVSNFGPEVAETFQFVFEKYKNSELLKIANKVYVSKKSQIKADYQKTIKQSYHAEAESVNFVENVATAALINDWVKTKTAGKITDLIPADSLNDNTRLVLLNALHFKGSWAHKFNASETHDDDFWTSENVSVKIPFMAQTKKFGYGYFEDLSCQALEMPYKDSDLSMLVLLPNEREGLKTLVEKLKTVNLVDMAGKLDKTQTNVRVQLPKFKADYSIELKPTLVKLGLKKIFNDEAEFDNMLESDEKIFVSQVFHKASIEVNEEGTEAAAATGMVMMCRSLPPQFVADRPFLYFIWNKKNILFAGAFVKAPAA